MEDLLDSGDDEEGMVFVRSNDNEDLSRYICILIGVFCSSIRVEVVVFEEVLDNRYCVDIDCKIVKLFVQLLEINVELQKEDIKIEYIRVVVINIKDQIEDFQEKDGMIEIVIRGEEDNKVIEEEIIRKVGILNIKLRLFNCLYLNMIFKFLYQFLIRGVYFIENQG